MGLMMQGRVRRAEDRSQRRGEGGGRVEGGPRAIRQGAVHAGHCGRCLQVSKRVLREPYGVGHAWEGAAGEVSVGRSVHL